MPVLAILAFVIWASSWGIGIKITFSVLILVFFSVVSRYLFTRITLLRKFKAALYASLFPIAALLLKALCSISDYKGVKFADLYSLLPFSWFSCLAPPFTVHQLPWFPISRLPMWSAIAFHLRFSSILDSLCFPICSLARSCISRYSWPSCFSCSMSFYEKGR